MWLQEPTPLWSSSRGSTASFNTIVLRHSVSELNDSVVCAECRDYVMKKARAEDGWRVRLNATKIFANADSADDAYAMTAERYKKHVRNLQRLSKHFNQSLEVKVLMIEMFNRLIRYIVQNKDHFSMNLEDHNLLRLSIACAAIAMKHHRDISLIKDSWERRVCTWFLEYGDDSSVFMSTAASWRDYEMEILSVLKWHIPLVPPSIFYEFVVQHEKDEEKQVLMQAIENMVDIVMIENVEAWDGSSVSSVKFSDTA